MVIEQNVGFKTKTSFKGTVNYVSEEMLKIFLEDCRDGEIDLYYNDLVGLKTTLNLLHCPQNEFELDFKNERSLVD